MSFVRVCTAGEVRANEPFRVQVGDLSILITKDNGDNFYAIADRCSHADIALSEGFVEDGYVECWAHGSKFCLKTGWPQNLPAFEPVPVFAIRVEDGEVFVDPTPIFKEKS